MFVSLYVRGTCSLSTTPPHAQNEGFLTSTALQQKKNHLQLRTPLKMGQQFQNLFRTPPRPPPRAGLGWEEGLVFGTAPVSTAFPEPRPPLRTAWPLLCQLPFIRRLSLWPLPNWEGPPSLPIPPSPTPPACLGSIVNALLSGL